MVLPTDVLGTEYIVPAWKANEKDGGSMLGTYTALFDYFLTTEKVCPGFHKNTVCMW